MRKWCGFVAIVLLFVSSMAVAATTGPFDPSRNASNDLAAAEQQAAAEHKNVLLDVGGNWCSWCILLDRFLHDNTDLAGLLKDHYVVVHVNMSRENPNAAFLARYPKIAGYPFLIVVSPQGKLLHAQDTDPLQNSENLQDGYSRKRVQAFLTKWSPRT
jgi:thioredoxin-related protein